MLGLLLAAVFGGLQFYLLVQVTRSVGQGKVNIAAGVGQFFCPLTALLICGFAAKEQLLVCAVGICVILLAGALIQFIRARRKGRDPQEKRD